MEPEELMGDQTYSSMEESPSAHLSTIVFEHADTLPAVQLERAVHNHNEYLLGTVTVVNQACYKEVLVRWTLENWK